MIGLSQCPVGCDQTCHPMGLVLYLVIDIGVSIVDQSCNHYPYHQHSSIVRCGYQVVFRAVCWCSCWNGQWFGDIQIKYEYNVVPIELVYYSKCKTLFLVSHQCLQLTSPSSQNHPSLERPGHTWPTNVFMKSIRTTLLVTCPCVLFIILWMVVLYAA